MSNNIRISSLLSQLSYEFEKILVENRTLKQQLHYTNSSIPPQSLSEVEEVESNEYPSPNFNDITQRIEKLENQLHQINSKIDLSFSPKNEDKNEIFSPNSTIFSNRKNVFGRLDDVFKKRTPTIKESWSPSYQLSGHTDGIWEISVSNIDEEKVVSCSADHCVILWSILSKIPQMIYTGHTGSVNSARFHPSDSLILTSSGDSSAHIFHFPMIEHDTNTSSISHSQPLPLQRARSHSWPGLTYSETSLDSIKSLLPLSIPIPLQQTSTSLPIPLNKPQISPIHTISSPLMILSGHVGPLTSADWLNDGSEVVTGSWDNQLRIYSAATGQNTMILKGHDGPINNISTNISSKTLISASSDHSFILWDLRSSANPINIYSDHSQSVVSAIFSPNHSLVASSSEDLSVHIWDIRMSKSSMTTIAIESCANRLVFAPDGYKISCPCDDGYVRHYHLSGELISEIETSLHQQVYSTAYANYHTFLSAGMDTLITGWTC